MDLLGESINQKFSEIEGTYQETIILSDLKEIGQNEVLTQKIKEILKTKDL